ncbi:SPTY2D1 family protein [Megaselia abdita]
MDFGQLISVAKKISQKETVRKDDNNKFYSTKFAPPKKESKEQKRLSDNIKKFLEKKEIEEREKKREEKEKLDKLLSMRDDKSKNKIRKMLKVTKSANKSVLEDAKGNETAVTANGSEQPDEDDYGYVSNEAAALFQKYCEKVKHVKDDKGFAKSRPQSRDDMKGTKERVRQALLKEQEEKLHPGQRIRVSNVSSTPHKDKSESSIRRGGRELYDPKAEREAEEKKRKEEEFKRKSHIKKKPPPPPMNFSELMKLAEKKQFEPVTPEVVEVKPKTKEPERLLTAKEKKDLEEREARKNNKFKTPAPVKPIVKEKLKEEPKKAPLVKQKTPYTGPSRMFPPKIIGSSSSISSTSSSTSSLQSQKKPIQKEVPPKEIQKTRPFPPKDTNPNQKTREFPPRDIQKTRDFPPPDVRRSKPSASSSDNRKAHKRRIIEDDDSEEYDSEMDDFIDDGEDEEDYSKHIRDIFKYDKSKYRDEYDDEPMESSFAQMQREEAFSKKMGLKEDLEDMRLEEEAKKKKDMMKKKMKYR